jgi:hypothetical protein
MQNRFSDNGKAKPPDNWSSMDFVARTKASKALRTKTEERLDRLTEAWRETEKKLIADQEPRTVYHVYSVIEHGHPDDPFARECSCIGIAKFAGKWRVCLGQFNEGHHVYEGGPIKWRPVTDSTMEERVVAAKYVNTLEQKIHETGEEFLPKIDEAIGCLEDYLGVV